MEPVDRMRELLSFIYGPDTGRDTYEHLRALLERWRSRLPAPDEEYVSGRLPLDHTDAVLITYGDQFRREGEAPLATLGEFLREYLSGTMKGVHILPFFHYSSDDGFSVIDYRTVNPEWGTWEEVRRISGEFRLMVDLVLNHCSAKSEWFRRFLQGDPAYEDFFITVEPGTDLSGVFRPRALPLVHEFESPKGPVLVWTTFSRDQVDLNYANPRVLLEMIDIFLFYVSQGAQIIRLDAIAYLWKELGTPCIHHPKTHAVVKLFRAICEEVCPWVLIITETNVPHEENISYFGDMDEAHLVYQFALPPLVLDAFLRKDVSYLREWARTIDTYGGKVSYFNFLASHDGIGVLPARGILPDEHIDSMIEAVKDRGGLISYKSTPEGEVPYELNINYLSAISEAHLDRPTRARKFLASQAVMLSLVGMPGIYVHSLLGSENWREGVEKTGMNRTINRQKCSYDEILRELEDPESLRSMVFKGYLDMLAARRKSRAFDPRGTQEVLDAPETVLALMRRSHDATEEVLCLINVSHVEQECVFPSSIFASSPEVHLFTELTSGDTLVPYREDEDRFSISLGGYEVLWLTPYRDRD
ncbi:sugar phosphorylase [Spirochaeta thermophila]|uniref:Glycosyl hydrolase family 13 catalytic domain-containing protein n=1 Tax=Winmispira thermophila (strain ATCC 49972 / DSM 6192 / RI 19.B1) TaxID=665571 RepID=E0RTJ0_WINT6|nr:sugar phosphorylase [Spirochaeta thermophila]ADN02221.1 hypothetical protein STHERM_c12800 [Spirochaeta thermophila DSM 6192]